MHIFEKILVGTSVISVGKSTFEKCVSLEEVFISSSIKKIIQNSFVKCSSLKILIFYYNRSGKNLSKILIKLFLNIHLFQNP